ncbi:PhnD/SsuA/transferrin family substrate-binding protein [Oceanithermus sp.]
MEARALSAIVCPHDTAKNVATWIEFLVVLGQLAGVEVGYTFVADFDEFEDQLGRAGLAYAHPLAALEAAERFGYLPVASPEHSDEVVFVVREGVEGGLEGFAGAEVASVPGQFATRFGCTLLRERGLAIGRLRPYASCQEVLEAVRSGGVDRGFLYKDFVDHLDPLSLEGVRVVEVTNTGRFRHVLMLHPDHAELRGALREGLARLPDHPVGGELLRELGLGAWTAHDDLGDLRTLQDC